MGENLLFGFVHGHCRYVQRRELWNDVINLQADKLLLVGDFNIILGAHERTGFGSHRRVAMQDFRNFLDEADLLPVSTTGLFYTWANRHRDGTYFESKLDRAVATESFHNAWADIHAFAGARASSDHSPLLISCAESVVSLQARPFRFQTMLANPSGS